MSNPSIASVHNLNPRFFRSTDLVRDFTDYNACSEYFVTPHVTRCLNRITAGFNDAGAGRAWRVTGDYGSGKSSFALFLSRIASGADLGRRLHSFCKRSDLIRKSNFLLPVLVQGKQAPVSEVVGKSLEHCLKAFAPALAKGAIGRRVAELIAIAQDARRSKNADDILLNLLPEVAAAVKSGGKYSGILLVIDEMGKLLEYAAQNPDRGDVYVLQQLAELTARTGKTPITVIGLLHQGFESYVSRHSLNLQQEWSKVAGRFDEIIFDHPIDQVAGLINMALGTDVSKLPPSIRRETHARMEQAIRMGWYGPSCSKQHLLDLAPRLYPIDPLALPAIYRTYRRYGQNERSLFSFLYSAEPNALRGFSQRPLKSGGFYGLPEFYDFAESNLTRSFAMHGYGSTWDVVSTVVANKPADEHASKAITKTIGILNLLGVTELVPTAEAVTWVVAGADPNARKQVSKAIDVLTRKDRLIFARGTAAGLCLWPHTSVDIQALQDKARKAVIDEVDIAQHIEKLLNHRPIVARRHYAKTGNMRAFQIRYCKVDTLNKPVEINFAETDGVILVPLVSNDAERKEAIRIAQQGPIRECPFAVVAVPQPLTYLWPRLIELMRWNWIVQSTPELASDRIAREEVSRQRETALLGLQRQVDIHFGVSRPIGRMDLKIILKGEVLKQVDGREFLSKLSDIAEEVYSNEPIIFNEMLNRRKPSSAAMAAWGKVMEGVFTQQTVEGFGMDLEKRPPEVAMYMSIYQKSRMHHRKGEQWELNLPKGSNDPCRLKPAFDRIASQIPMGGLGRLAIPTLITSLQQPPYGIRTGIIHFLLTSYIAHNQDDTALYENGTFLREVGYNELLRLIRAPERFEIQRVGIQGLRRDLFRQIAEALSTVTDVPSRDSDTILSVVQPLCRFVTSLPQYSLTTKKLSAHTIAVREFVMHAREPAKLLFVDLPAAVGYPGALSEKETNPRTIQKVVGEIQTCLIDVSTAYEDLLGRIGDGLLDGLSSQGMTIESMRPRLADRATQALLYAEDFKLRAFCSRLQDKALDRLRWLEALGSFVMSKTPKAWSDQDEAAYKWRIIEVCDQFQRVEAVTYRNGHDPRHSLRIAITRPTGEEQMKVVHYSAEEDAQIKEIQSQVKQLFSKSPRLSIIAATKELWSAMETAKKEQKS